MKTSRLFQQGGSSGVRTSPGPGSETTSRSWMSSLTTVRRQSQCYVCYVQQEAMELYQEGRAGVCGVERRVGYDGGAWSIGIQRQDASPLLNNGLFCTWAENWKKQTSVFSNDHHAWIGMYFYSEHYKAQLIRRSEVRLRDKEGDWCSGSDHSTRTTWSSCILRTRGKNVRSSSWGLIASKCCVTAHKYLKLH